MAYYDIGEVFQKIEEDMIASMMRNLKRHLSTEKEEGINYAMWQAEQLAALNEFKRKAPSLFGNYFSTINDQIEEVLEKAHASGKMEQEAQILEAIMEGWSTALKPSGTLQGAFFRINDRKLKALIKSVKSDMKKAETAMLRRANDEYRKIVFNSQAYYNTGAGTLPQCVDMATKDFLSRGISCIEYANGARVGIDVYSRMAIRTAVTRAYLLGESAKRDEWGISTVIVNKRGVACPRCLKYVGRVFYDDVWGSAPIPYPEKYPRLSEAIAGGLYHPNCKDVHTTYFEGVTKPPKPMTDKEKKEASRVYNLEQQQRYNERQIRKYKRLAYGSVDPENRDRYYKKLSEWQGVQKRFVKANGDVLKRRYENEKLLVTEFADLPTEAEKISKNQSFVVENKVIESREYIEKFAKMTDNPDERREYYKASKEILNHRSGQNGEDLYLYNTRTKKWYKSTSGKEAGKPEYTKEIHDAINKSKPGELVSFHNHPSSMPPSAYDVNAAFKNGYLKGYALCHNGKIYEYTASKSYIDPSIYEITIAKFKKVCYNDFDAQIKAMEYLSGIYGFSFKEVK
jgi:hypothetical protein